MGKPWPRYTITVPPFGWKVKYHDITVADIEAVKDASDINQQRALVCSVIEEWDATDLEGNPLPICPESFAKLPRVAAKAIADAVAEGGDPKAEKKSTTS